MRRHHRSAPPSPGRRRALLAAMGLGLLLAAVLSLLLGSTRLSLAEVIGAARAGEQGSAALRIFLYVRLPRTLGGALCGCAMAVSGAVLQAVLNNSLAGPNIIGVNAGAGLATLVVMALFPAAVGLLPAAAFLGALGCALLIYTVARCTGASRTTIVLAGLAVSGVINALGGCIRILFPDVLVSYTSFTLGTLSGVTMGEVGAALPYIALGVGLALLLGREMNVLALGEETAQALGLHVESCRLALIVIAALLAGAAVSFAGLVGFVGLLVPHAARLLLGSDARWVAAASALMGAGTVLLCDVVGRVLFAPFELPVGLVLSLVGGCGFVALLLRRRGGRIG